MCFEEGLKCAKFHLKVFSAALPPSRFLRLPVHRREGGVVLQSVTSVAKTWFDQVSEHF